MNLIETQTLLRKCSFNCYSKTNPQLVHKNWLQKCNSKGGSQTLLKKWSTKVTSKATKKRESIQSNEHRRQKCSKTFTCFFFDWKIAVTSYKKRDNSMKHRLPTHINNIKWDLNKLCFVELSQNFCDWFQIINAIKNLCCLTTNDLKEQKHMNCKVPKKLLNDNKN